MRAVCTCACIVTAALMATATAAASATPIGVFGSPLIEDFESYPFGTTANPFDILANQAHISGTHSQSFYVWSHNNHSLGSSGVGQASSPTHGLTSQGQTDNITITFDTPVTQFGAYWAIATGFGLPDPAVLNLDFYDAGSNLVGTGSFSYSKSTTQSGEMDWHGWSFTSPVSSIEFTGKWIAMDDMRTDLVPEPSAILLVAFGACGLLRRR